MKYSPLYFVLVLLSISACVKYEKYPYEEIPESKYCAAYDNYIFQYWFPYTEGARYVFSDTMGNTRTLTINEVIKSGVYKDTMDRCDASAALYAYGNLPAESEITFSVNHNTTQLPNLPDENNLTIKLYNQTFRLHANEEGYDLDAMDVVGDSYYSYFHDRMNIGEHSYTSVFEFRAKSDQNIKSIFIAKRVGLLGFTFRNDHSFWVKGK